MAKSYYGSKISDNMARTPEGFLICFNVPIGRTGEYKYLGSEVGDGGNEIISVYRTEEELFDQLTLASFEGKAFTDDHPIDDVTPDNWSIYAKGELSNVRRGKGEYADCIVADIIVRDPVTISEIETGIKREVSSGYTCDYIEKNGKTYQSNIRGNHVSLVKNGRAGSRVSIKDKAIENNKNNIKIAQALLAISNNKPNNTFKNKVKDNIKGGK